jgi:hypothetical protein
MRRYALGPASSSVSPERPGWHQQLQRLPRRLLLLLLPLLLLPPLLLVGVLGGCLQWHAPHQGPLQLLGPGAAAPHPCGPPPLLLQLPGQQAPAQAAGHPATPHPVTPVTPA